MYFAAYYLPKTYTNAYRMSIYKVIDYISKGILLLFVFSLRIHQAEIWFENHIKANYFLLNYLCVGLVFVAAYIYFLYKYQNEYFSGGEDNQKTIFFSSLAIICITIVAASYGNMQTAKQHTYQKKAFLMKKGENVRYHTDYLHLKMENRIERFNAPAKEYDALSINDSVILVLGKGILNYEYIFHFLPNDKTQEKN